MNIKLLANIIDGKILNKRKNVQIGKICIDSRTLKKGETFLAFKGNNFDGHDFIKKALKKKPSCIIISKQLKIKTKVPIIVVDNTNEAFYKLAKFYRNNFDGVVIGITGSCGKTSTKEILNDILKTKYKVVCNKKNYNNKIGVSLTLFDLKKDTQILIVECGTNHVGEMKEIADIVNPNIVLLTNIGTSHIGNFGSKKNIFKEKKSLVDKMTEGVLFLNGDDKYLNKINNKNIEIYKTYNRNSIVELKKVCCFVDFSVILFNYNGEEYEVKIPVFSKGMIDNILLVMECCLFLDIDISKIINKLTNLVVVNKRQQKIILKNDNILIDDSYNASYESVVSLLDNIKLYDEEKIIILGSMKELGKYSNHYHKLIAKKIKKFSNFKLFLIGEETKIIKKIIKNSLYFNDINELENYFLNNNFRHVLFVVKGANAVNLTKVAKLINKKYS